MKIKQTLMILLIIGMLFVLPASQVIAQRAYRYRYVVPGGSTTSDYCTAYDPCDLRYAIDVVADPDDILIVHSGTYTSSLMSEDLVFIDKNLTLWGSCEFDSSTPFHCHPEEMSSILDGQNTKRVIRIDGSLGNENVYIEGFTIKRGLGTGSVPCYLGMNGCGAGIHAKDLAMLTIKSNFIWQNKSGMTSGFGGGLYAENIGFLQVEDNTFDFNLATVDGMGAGGAAFVTDSGGPNAVVFENNRFYYNELSTEFNSGNAGGALLINASNNVRIQDNVFQYQNDSLNDSFVRGTSIRIMDTSYFVIEGNFFWGDGIGNSVVSITDANENYGHITRNKWWYNKPYYTIALEGNFNVEIANNFLGSKMLTTLSRGGGSTLIYLKGKDAGNLIDADILFNTFAAASIGVEINDYVDAEIYGNIFTELSEGIISTGTTSIHSINRNLFYHNSTYNTLGVSPILENPKLRDVDNGDFHLMPGSGAIDKATAINFCEDIDGELRPFGSGLTPYDVGADEFITYFYLPIITK